jgi:tRNA A-37 threonylcarbamoyl transferase component Bud32
MTDKLHGGWTRRKTGAFSWLVDRSAPDWPELFAQPDEVVAGAQDWLRRGGAKSGSRVARWTLPRGDRVVVKQYCARTSLERIKIAVRRSRAQHALSVLLALREIGVRSLAPVAAGHRIGQPWESYLVTEEVLDARPMLEVRSASGLAQRRAIRSLAVAMAKMHNAALFHGDAHHANFLTLVSGEVLLADVDGVRRRARITTKDAARNLARLLDHTSATPREKLYFAAVYSRERGGTISSRELVEQMGAGG